MAKFDFELEVQPRETLGKGASRRLRRCEDKVLGVVYGGNEKAQPITLAHHHVVKALENEAIYSHILTITSNGKKQTFALRLRSVCEDLAALQRVVPRLGLQILCGEPAENGQST